MSARFVSRFEILNPADESTVSSVPAGDEESSKKAIDSSHRAFSQWKKRPVIERTFLHEAIYDEFLEKFTSKVKNLTVGPQFSDVNLGPKVLKEDVSKISSLIDQAVSAGAKLHYDGKKTDSIFQKGNWCFPAIVTNVSSDMDIMKKEIFGPVVPIAKIKNFEQAIEMANDCEYGLAAYLWTADAKRIMNSVSELEFGEIYVNRGIGEQPNGYHTGFKKSGIAGEDGKYGLENYLHKKTYYLNYED